MQSTALPRPKTASTVRQEHGRAALWTSLAALAATIVLGVAAPRFAGHAQARPEVAASQSAAVQERSVPTASSVFEKPAGDAVNEAQAPSF